ncbi:MAG: tetratricopeptide repeat protein [bacterium]
MRTPSWRRLAYAFAACSLIAAAAHAQEDPGKLFTYLQDLYNRHDKNLSEFLIDELNQYVMRFPDGEKAPEAQYLLAKVYQEKGDKHKALAAFLKVMSLYPHADRRQESANEARLIITSDNAYKEKRTALLATLETPPAGENPADRYYHYLNRVTALGNDDVANVLLDDARKFLAQFAEDTRQDSVLLVIAELYARKGDERETEASYLRLEYYFPESPLLPYARFSRGVILSKELGDHKRAIEVLSEVVTKHPQSEHAATAQLEIAEIKREKLKDYAGAVADYRKFIESKADSAKAVEALWAIGETNLNNLKDYNGAIQAFSEIVEKHQADKRAASAMEKVGDIYKDKLADYGKAAEQYAQIAEVFPEYEKAPDLLLKAGALCEDKLKDDRRAAEYYRRTFEKFPKHKSADEAKKRIEKAQKKSVE